MNKEERIGEEQEIDLLELFLYLLSKWKIILLAVFLGGGISFMLYQYTVKPVYKANAELYITNSGTVIDFQDVQLSAELTVDYEEIILSRLVLKKVISDQQLDADYKALKERITVTNPKDSHCLVIAVTADTSEEAVRVTNSLVKYGIDQIYRIVGKDQPSVIDSAEADAVEMVQPSKKKFVLIGALLGVVLVCIVYVIFFFMDSTLKYEEDIEKYLGMNVLAIVPEDDCGKRRKQ